MMSGIQRTNNPMNGKGHSTDMVAAADTYVREMDVELLQDSADCSETERPLPLNTLRQIAEVQLPTRWAHFRLLAFEAVENACEGKSERRESGLALVLGDIYHAPPLVRIHSQCATGDIFHSLRCDCHDQLHLALDTIASEGAGVLIYEHQEGRGIGLMEKLRAYELQDKGLDTIEANLHLGHAADLRDYRLPVDILRFLKLHAVRLLTNNPEKVDAVNRAGIEIIERVSAEVPGSPYSARYLATKREKMGHISDTETPGLAPLSNIVTAVD
jgi:GTP cyclohydrolase II